MTGTDITVDGGGLLWALVALLLVVATIVVGVWVALIAYRKYQTSGDRPTLYLAAGIVLISTVHTSVILVFSNAGVSQLFSDSLASAVQFVGLLFILYAVYGQPERGGYPELVALITSAILIIVIPFALLEVVTVELQFIQISVNGVPAIVGAFVALQAYRGYRHYQSVPMLLLSVGIAMLAIAPFLISLVLHGVAPVSDATALSVLWLAQFGGLLSILRSLTV